MSLYLLKPSIFAPLHNDSCVSVKLAVNSNNGSSSWPALIRVGLGISAGSIVFMAFGIRSPSLSWAMSKLKLLHNLFFYVELKQVKCGCSISPRSVVITCFNHYRRSCFCSYHCTSSTLAGLALCTSRILPLLSPASLCQLLLRCSIHSISYIFQKLCLTIAKRYIQSKCNSCWVPRSYILIVQTYHLVPVEYSHLRLWDLLVGWWLIK